MIGDLAWPEHGHSIADAGVVRKWTALESVRDAIVRERERARLRREASEKLLEEARRNHERYRARKRVAR